MVHQKLLIASRNIRKVSSLKALIREFNPYIEVVSLLDTPHIAAPEIDLPEFTKLQSLKERSEIKARVVSEASQCITLADEWGLIIPSLGGEKETVKRKNKPNKNLLPDTSSILRELNGKDGIDRMAFCECVQTLFCPKKGIIKTISARIEGFITEDEKGESSTEFSSIFIKHDYGKTMGELPQRVQTLLSPRRKAIEGLSPHLERLSRISP